MVRLNPITEEEFSPYLERLALGYAEDKVRSGTWEEKDAIELAEADLKGLLPDGKDTDQNSIFLVKNDEGDHVGFVWLNRYKLGQASGIFIYDIIVEQEHRRKGYGTQILAEVENIARRNGVNRISLHVFAHNEEAIELYMKCGYRVTDVEMEKSLQ